MFDMIVFFESIWRPFSWQKQGSVHCHVVPKGNPPTIQTICWFIYLTSKFPEQFADLEILPSLCKSKIFDYIFFRFLDLSLITHLWSFLRVNVHKMINLPSRDQTWFAGRSPIYSWFSQLETCIFWWLAMFDDRRVSHPYLLAIYIPGISHDISSNDLHCIMSAIEIHYQGVNLCWEKPPWSCLL